MVWWAYLVVGVVLGTGGVLEIVYRERVTAWRNRRRPKVIRETLGTTIGGGVLLLLCSAILIAVAIPSIP